MQPSRSVDLSILLPFADHEDVLGAACRRLARHLRELGVAFEIVAVDEGSTDNSPVILSLLRRELPELHRISSPGAGRGFAAGASHARGRTLLLMRPESAMSTLAPVGRALRRVQRGELDLAVVDDRFAVAHRTRCLPALAGGRDTGFQRLARRVRGLGLSTEIHALGGGRGRGSMLEGRLFRWLEALAPARFAR